MIVCRTCNQEKEDEEFYRYTPTEKHRKGSLKACKVCVRAAQQKFRKDNSAYYAKQSKERYLTNKLRGIEYKGGKCADCGNTYPPSVYDFHHEDPTQKDPKWSIGVSWKKLALELDKCVLLCSNCHRIRHWEGYGEI